MTVDRRAFIRRLLIGTGFFSLAPRYLFAKTECTVMHPLMPPVADLPGTCKNCGMQRPMWARTWHTFTVQGQKMEVCSMHCLAESSLNSGSAPENVVVSLYLDPHESVAAQKAYYVIGSSARGTMSMKSKIAFSSKKQAEDFVKTCGGEIAGFEDAYLVAKASITKENKMIQKNRLAKGKIVEPVASDICPVCGMYPVKYPKNKCQIRTRDGEVIHFCATQCLFEYLENPSKYSKKDLKVLTVWVVDYENGQYIYGYNSYYVLGTDVTGPMGKEAFPFASKKSAQKFSSVHGGTVLKFHEVTAGKILL